MNIDFNKIFKGNKTIWICIGFLFFVSILVVYSSSSVLAHTNAMKYGGDESMQILRHTFLSFIGLIAIIIVSHINPSMFYRFADVALVCGIVGLLLVFVMGTSLNGSSRWIRIAGMSVQPSEFAKITLVLFIAKQLSKHIDNPKDAFLPIMVATCVVCAIIMYENLSTCLLTAITCWLMMLYGRIPMKYLMGLVVVALMFLLLVIVFAPEVKGVFPRAMTWRARVERFIGVSDETEITSKHDDYQANQAAIAVGSGGLAGKGPGHSYMKNFLPMSYSDFVFAIILEEYGLWGAAFVMFAYTLLFVKCIGIMKRCEKYSHMFIVGGLATLYCLQAIINMCVGVGLIPVTGQTLPFVSMGGSSSLFTGLAFGIILSISNSIEHKVEEPKATLAELHSKNEEIEENIG